MEGIWKARRHSALEFDRVDDYVEVPYSSSLNPDEFTVEGWARVKGGKGTARALVSSRDSPPASGYILYAAEADCWSFWIGSGSWVSVDGPQITLGKWYHVAATYKDEIAILYVDTLSYGPKSITLSKNTQRPLRVGAGYNESFPMYFFDGSIASVRIYNRALSEAEIKYLYYNPDDPLDTDHLVLWLHPGSIDTDAGYWWDISGRDNHGQIFGATKVSLVSPEVTVL